MRGGGLLKGKWEKGKAVRMPLKKIRGRGAIEGRKNSLGKRWGGGGGRTRPS